MRNSSRIVKLLLLFSLFGHAHWFFGNLYEAVVQPSQPSETGASLFARGSPVRYYVPLAPLTVIATVATLLLGWRPMRQQRRWLVTATALSVSAALLTTYIVTQLNIRLFFNVSPVSAEERADLMAQWFTLNYGRLGLVACAWFSALSAMRGLEKP